MLLASGSGEADGWQARGIAIACITFAVLVHAILPKTGMRLFDVLGVFKVVILLFVVCSGFAALAGHRKVPNPHNFDNAVWVSWHVCLPRLELEVIDDFVNE